MLERAIADLEANEAAALKAFNDEKRTEIKEMGGRNSTKRSAEQTGGRATAAVRAGSYLTELATRPLCASLAIAPLINS